MELARWDVRRAPSSCRPATRRTRRSAWPSRSTPDCRSSPCRPRTNATPIRATRYGSSPKVSSVRPQRGSRQTSSTGARPWCAPTARICIRIASPSARASSGSHVLASADRLREDGRLARHQPGADLLVHDRGDPEPRLLDEVLLDRVCELARCARASSELAPEMRVTCPRPCSEQRRSPLAVELAVGSRAGRPRRCRAARSSRRASSARGGRRSARRPSVPDPGRRARCRRASPIVTTRLRAAQHEPRTTSCVGSIPGASRARRSPRSARSGDAPPR